MKLENDQVGYKHCAFKWFNLLTNLDLYAHLEEKLSDYTRKQVNYHPINGILCGSIMTTISLCFARKSSGSGLICSESRTSFVCGLLAYQEPYFD